MLLLSIYCLIEHCHRYQLFDMNIVVVINCLTLLLLTGTMFSFLVVPLLVSESVIISKGTCFSSTSVSSISLLTPLFLYYFICPSVNWYLICIFVNFYLSCASVNFRQYVHYHIIIYLLTGRVVGHHR